MAVEQLLRYLLENPSWTVLGFAACAGTYFLLSRIVGGARSRGNPFATDQRRPREVLVTNQEAKNAILKRRFKESKVPADLDVIVIGSGAGGLVAALLLARAGKKVLVLEQHDQAGGCCHTFVEKGFEFDTGIHYIGSMDNTETRDLMDQLTCGQLDWAPMADEFDTLALGSSENAKRFSMKSGQQKYFDNLITLFPQEEAAIKEYRKRILNSMSSFYGFVLLKALPRPLVIFLYKMGLFRLFSCFKHMSVSLQETLDGLTDNQDLKAVLSYLFGDYGVLPKDVPFFLHALLVYHYWDGAYYPVGGPSEIAYQMVHTIEHLGGRVLVQAAVTDILCDDSGRAVGVRVGRSSGSVDIFAKTIVSDAGVSNTFKKLLPTNVAEKSCTYPVVDKVGPGFSFITAFVGLDGSPAELQLPSGNMWYYSSNDLNKAMSDYLALPPEEVASAPLPMCYISFPSAKDPTWEERYPGKSSLMVITLARWDWFEQWQHGRKNHRGEDYEGMKNSIGERMWKVCCDLLPQLDGKKVYMTVGTPVTNKYYLGSPVGEMYGLNQTLSRFSPEAIIALRCDTDIPGLYLTGQDTLTCGFVAVLYAGLTCASLVLGRNLMSDFSKLMRSIKAKECSEKAM